MQYISNSDFPSLLSLHKPHLAAREGKQHWTHSLPIKQRMAWISECAPSAASPGQQFWWIVVHVFSCRSTCECLFSVLAVLVKVQWNFTICNENTLIWSSIVCFSDFEHFRVGLSDCISKSWEHAMSIPQMVPILFFLFIDEWLKHCAGWRWKRISLVEHWLVVDTDFKKISGISFSWAHLLMGRIPTFKKEKAN